MIIFHKTWVVEQEKLDLPRFVPFWYTSRLHCDGGELSSLPAWNVAALPVIPRSSSKMTLFAEWVTKVQEEKTSEGKSVHANW